MALCAVDTKDTMPEIVDVLNEPSWDLAVADTDGELFQSRPWMRCLAETFGFNFQASVERDDRGSIVEGIPFVRIDDLRGPRTVVLPFSDYVLPLVADDLSWKCLVEPLLAFGDPVIVQTSADSCVARDGRFVPDLETIRHAVAFDADRETIVARFGQQPRRHIRKAEKSGLTFRMANTRAELQSFYDLHFGVRKYKHQLLCQPFALFESLWRNFIADGDGGVMLGFDGDVVAGGCLLLEAGETLYYKYSASHPDYRSKGVSHGAVMGAIDYGLEQGLLRLDLGRSDLEPSGLVDFKRRFGSTSSTLMRFCHLPAGTPDAPLCHHGDALDDAGELLTELTELFVDPLVPDELTMQAGERLYRYFA